MDRLLEELLEGVFADNFLVSTAKNRYPRLNIKKLKDDEFEVVASVPGLKKEDIVISLPEPNILQIEVKKKEDDSKYIVKEIPFRNSKRLLQSREPIDENSVKATLKDGLLYIKFKLQSTKEKSIPIL